MSFTQLKLNAYGLNSYSFEKDFKENPPVKPAVPGFPNSALKEPKTSQTALPSDLDGEDKLRTALMGVDVETILIDRRIGLVNMLKRENVDATLLENLVASNATTRELLKAITKDLSKFYKKLNQQYLTADQKQKAIEQKYSDFREYPAELVKKAEEILEMGLDEEGIPLYIDTLDPALFYVVDEDLEEGLLPPDAPIMRAEEAVERFNVIGGETGGGVGDAFEGIIAGDAGARLRDGGLFTDANPTRGVRVSELDEEIEEQRNTIRLLRSSLRNPRLGERNRNLYERRIREAEFRITALQDARENLREAMLDEARQAGYITAGGFAFEPAGGARPVSPLFTPGEAEGVPVPRMGLGEAEAVMRGREPSPEEFREMLREMGF